MTTTTQKTINIRQATADDAAEFVDLLKVLDSESNFLLWEPGERNVTADQQGTRLSDAFNSTTKRFSVAIDTDANALIGFCWCAAGTVIRKQHEVSVAMAVLQKHHGRGAGTALLNAQISWAKAHKFHRMSLSVSPANFAAIHIYKKAGFVLEGTERDSIKLGDRYEDSLIMGLILAA